MPWYEDVKFWLMVTSFIASGVLAVWRVSWVVGEMVRKIDKQIETTKTEFNAMLTLREAENGKAIGRVYERFDDYKKILEDKFLTKDLHSAIYASHTNVMSQINSRLEKLETKMDTLLFRKADE